MSPWRKVGASGPSRNGADTDGAFYVRDNGAGFAMDHAENLFRPYGRLHEDHDFPGTSCLEGFDELRRQRLMACRQRRHAHHMNPGLDGQVCGFAPS